MHTFALSQTLKKCRDIPESPASVPQPSTCEIFKIKMAASGEGMYRVPTYYNSDGPLSLPTCMYSLPNYHKSDSFSKVGFLS